MGMTYLLCVQDKKDLNKTFAFELILIQLLLHLLIRLKAFGGEKLCSNSPYTLQCLVKYPHSSKGLINMSSSLYSLCTEVVKGGF